MRWTQTLDGLAPDMRLFGGGQPRRRAAPKAEAKRPLHLKAAPSLQGITDALYDAALEPGLWPEVIADVARYGRSSFALMSWRDKVRTIGGPALRVETDHSDMADRYFAGPIAEDPILKCLEGPVDAVYMGSEAESPNKYRNTDRYKRFFRPCDIEDRVWILALKQSDEQSAILTLGRGRFEDSFSRKSLVPLQQISPHVRRALQITYRFRRDAARRASLLEALGHVGDGVFFLDASRRLMAVNPSGEEMVDSGILSVKEGRLRAPVPAESATLDSLIDAAIKTSQRAGTNPGGMLVLHRKDGTIAATVTVSPLRTSNASDGLGRKPVRAAVFVREDLPAEPSKVEAVWNQFGLTAAETRVAQDLVRGMRIQEIADRHNLGRETVRSQLKALFDKTGARRQSDLMKVLLTGGNAPLEN